MLNSILQIVIYTSLFLGFFLIAKKLKDFLTPYQMDEELTQKDNIALCISVSGYLGATGIIFVGAMMGPQQELWRDVLLVAGYAGLGVLMLNAARIINDKVILYKFSNMKEILEDRNCGTGAVQFGSYVASGLIIAGAIHGEGGGPHTTIIFFLLGQVSLIAFTWVYNKITPFDIHDEIEDDNVAAGVAFGGTLIAFGILMMNAASIEFTSWMESLGYFALDAVLGFIFLPLIRFFFDKMIIPHADLSEEIQTDRNLGASFLEASIAITFAAVLFMII